MKHLIILFGLFGAQITFGQLKGAIPQSNVPVQVSGEKKQVSNNPIDVAKNNADKLTKSLKLNQKQNKELYAALLEYESNVAKTNNSKTTKKEKFVKIKALNNKRQDKLKAIFTPEQYSTYISSFP